MSAGAPLLAPSALVRGRSRFGSMGIPRGWFAVAFSEEITPGAVHRLRYFGRDLVAYRGESGAVYVSDAYCPHLGAHLGHGGRVEGESIRCPFHGWRFDGEGRCVEIPYTDKIPPRARLGSMPVREQNGVVHVFHDPHADPAQPVAPWELPVLPDEGWTPGRSVLWRSVATHPQEVFENTVDTAHIGPIHAGRGARLIGKPEMERERMRVEIEFQAPGDIVGMPDQINDVFLEVTLRGLGWVLVHTHVRNVDVRARQRIYVTPVEEESVDIRAMIHVRETDDPAFTEELARVFHAAYVEDFAKDFPIWENKRYVAKPQLAKGDGPIGAYRQWCTQFYPPKVAATPAVTAPGVSAAAGAWSRVVERVTRVVARARRSPVAPIEGAKASPSASAPAVAKTPVAAATRRVRSAAEYFETLPERFMPAAAKGVDAVFQWELSGEGAAVFHAHVRDGAMELALGPHAQPSVALVMPAEDYVRVVNGELDGTRAFTTGRGKVRGSLPLAMKMRTLFPA